jgi:hypothetical protein
MDAASLTHVIGADLVSAPVFEGSPLTDDDDHDGLEATLSALLAVNPKLSIHLVLTNRCAGGAVSALAGSAGVQHIGGVTFDPALFRFERRCARLGLAAAALLGLGQRRRRAQLGHLAPEPTSPCMAASKRPKRPKLC